MKKKQQQNHMQPKKSLKIGSSNFKRTIENNLYFVDKTILAKEFIDNSYDIQLITRPRRLVKP